MPIGTLIIGDDVENLELQRLATHGTLRDRSCHPDETLIVVDNTVDQMFFDDTLYVVLAHDGLWYLYYG